MKTTGERIRELREMKGWTLDVLAAKAKISKGFLSEIENDKTNVSSKFMLKIAGALGASVDYLLKGDGNKSQDAESIVVPRELSEAAEESNWTYGEILELLGAHNSVVARRSDREQKEFTAKDWKELYNTIKRLFK